ncbi:hypothetical protein F183_A18520 [Bryobacterales bacterium F-183]|nr:hypothetical protein F183_A18520 [Bryobacterales bacterium F-183]
MRQIDRKRLLSLPLLFAMAASSVVAFGQVQQPPAGVTKDDWEEINFEFNSAVLTDGFPSLLRIAELLKGNPAYRVRLDGHTDGIGSSSYNDALGAKRAEAVRDFLVKYGAASNQIQIVSKGEKDPAARGEKPVFTRTDEARWINRRVAVTVLDGNGKTIAAGGAADAVRGMKDQVASGAMKDCCNDVLKRLDLLDEILTRLKDLQDKNAQLQRDMDAMKSQHAAIMQKLGLNPDGTASATGASSGLMSPGGATGGSAQVGLGGPVDTRPSNFSGDPLSSKFSLLGINVGPDSNGNATFSGRGRYFSYLGDNFAVQAQGEYLYYHTQREGQFDIGLVNRIGRFQGSLFSSFKHVNLRGMASGGTLGQAAFTADYLFGRGRIGVFGTKAFMDEAVVNRANVILANGMTAANLMREDYLRVVDQAGVSGVVGLVGNTYAEGNLGYLKAYGSADRMGGTLRFVVPVSEKIGFTVEGGVNETFMGRSGSTGRAVFGVQWGNLMRPKNFLASGKPVPVDVPRVRYELLNRTVRTGPLQPPVADAGPDQIGVPAGLVRLDGSNSYDPNGEQLTYQWVQETGPAIALSSPTAVATTFNAAAGEMYGFRLTVRNTSGLSASARVRVTTRSEDRVQILFFIANPTRVAQGASSELQWKVVNADEVTITPSLGKVALEGRSSVIVNENITYTLTAKNRTSEATSSVTITVDRPETRVVSCFATPTNIVAGESSTISYLTQNATSVMIEPGVGTVQPNGTVTVSPTSTTTYRVIATGVGGQTATCSTTVSVNTAVGLPRVVRFTATPPTIDQGQSSTLEWQTEGATSVTISTLGSSELNGARAVSPSATTTYTLTATNSAGSTTATATVFVNAGVRITSFTANPPVSPRPGAQVLLTCLADNAVTINIQPNNGQNITAQTLVYPRETTTYTCTATGRNGQTVTQSLTVQVTPETGNPGPDPNVPVVSIRNAPLLETNVRQVTLDGSLSTSPSGDLPLTYRWSSPNTQAAIQSPTSAVTIVQLNQLIGDYLFYLDVTDSKGRTARNQIVVRLVKQPIP